ncbi:MAG: hypothetical protein D6758_04305 [Gammaproteobacteria bacterium]|nr:MAG: hypothetical protein D6758_04305 [Gammaproteobacteria bacterium]
MSNRGLILTWLLLLTATGMTALLPAWGGAGVLLIGLGLMGLKNALIVERFMQMRRAPWLWRGLLNLYTPAVALMVWLLLH